MKKRFGFHIVKQEEDSTEEIVDDIIEELKEEQDPMQEMALKIKVHKYQFYRKIIIAIVIVLLLALGVGLYLKYQTYQGVAVDATYKSKESDNSNYMEYAGGVLKYSRDGVVFLNKKGEEVWNQPCQMQNPVVEVCKGTAAVGDQGGTSILIFQKDGLKGEIKATSPIQKMVVSEQGIVGAVLKGEPAQQIVCYDKKGNILVEQKTSLVNTGYPLDIALSNNGKVLLVSYLYTEGSKTVTKVVCYHFGKEGEGKKDHQIFEQIYDENVIPTVAFLDEKNSVLVGNDMIVFCKGVNDFREVKKIKIKKEIESVAYNESGVVMILKNAGKTEYELRLYDKNGKQILSKDFEGEYGNIKIAGNQVILYDGNQCMIWTRSGICKFEGKMETNIMEIFPLAGLNKYMMISADGLHQIHLIK